MYKALLKKTYLKIRKILLSPFLLKKNSSITAQNINKILLLRNDRVGDMTLSTPVFSSLKKRYPDAKITVLASENNQDIIRNNPNVDEIIIYKGIRCFMNETRVKNFDMAIDLFFTHKIKQALLIYLSGAKYRLGFKDSGREMFFNVGETDLLPQTRMVEHLLDLAKTAGAETDNCAPEIFLSDEEKEWAHSLLSKEGFENSLKIAMHPGAFYPSQRWPAERFGELAGRIIDHSGARVLIFGDKKEEHLLKAVKERAGNDAHIFCGYSLRQFMAMLNRCNLLICNNSGPLHIASALKIPTVSMTGPTVVPLWSPWGNNHIVLNKKLSCSPCNKVSCGDHSCLNLITVNEVMDAVVGQLEAVRA